MTTPQFECALPPSPTLNGFHAQSDECARSRNARAQAIHRLARRRAYIDPPFRLSPVRPRCVSISLAELKESLNLARLELEMDRMKVQMFSKARDVSIRDSEINNVGGDLTINNYNVLLQPDSEPVQVPLSSNATLYLPQLNWSTWGHLTQPFSDLKSKMEKVAEDALKYPPLLNATILLSKTSLYIPGVINQLLSSVRYSFF